jgi:hypothetical protein
MIGGAIAVDVKGPLIIFEKYKGMTNAKGNVDSNLQWSSTTRSEPIYKSARKVSASQILLGLNINRVFFKTMPLVIQLIGQSLPFANQAFRKSLLSLLARRTSIRSRASNLLCCE